MTRSSPPLDRTAGSTADLEGFVGAVGALRWERLSARTRARAVRVLCDTVGALMGGAVTAEVSELVRRGPRARPDEDGTVSLLVPGLPPAPLDWVAFVHGTAVVSLELDECAPGNGGHAAAHVVPVALAVAQAGHRTGPELLTALVAGYEVAARMGQAHEWHPAVHGHGHVGTVGGAVAAALLQGVDPVRAAQMAAHLPLLTVQQACLDGATARNAWTGVSATVALLAVRMASAGFTASPAARAEALGTVLGREVGTSPYTDPLDDQHLRLLANSVKFHSACYETHGALDAALALGPVDADDVIEVVVEMPVPHLTGLPNGTALGNRFSVPYGVATALVHGSTAPAAFEPDERVTDLARRVAVRAAPDLRRRTPDAEAARVTVRTAAGSTSAAVDLPRGHHPDEPGDAALEAKFRTTTWAADPGALFRRLIEVERCDDVADLFGDLV